MIHHTENKQFSLEISFLFGYNQDELLSSISVSETYDYIIIRWVEGRKLSLFHKMVDVLSTETDQKKEMEARMKASFSTDKHGRIKE